MGSLAQQFSDSVAGIVGSGVVQLSLRLSFAYLLIVWLACAYWAFRDMQSRTDNLILPYAAGALVLLSTPILFPLGLLVYRIVRPSERIAESRERALSESVLLAEAGEIEQCAGCHRIVQSDWISCPRCRTELREHCPKCDRLVEFDWLACAWCGTDFGRESVPASPAREPIPVMDERTTAEPSWQTAVSQIAAMTGLSAGRKARSK